MNHNWIAYLPGFISKRLKDRLGLQQIISNVAWLVFDKIGRMGVGVVVSVWVARYLGPEKFGIINYSMSFVALFMIFSYLGLDGIVIRELAQHPEKRKEILGSAFLLRFICGLLAFGLAVVTIVILHPGDVQMLYVVSITAILTITQAFDVIDMWFQSQVASKYTVIARNISFFGVTATRCGLILMKAPLLAFVWAGVAEYILSAVALVIVYQGRDKLLLAWRWSQSCAKWLLKDSWPLLLASFSMVTYQKIDQVMLGEMIGSDAVGIYAAAAKISEIWYFLPMAIVSSLFPSVLKVRGENRELYYRRLQRLFCMMTAISLALAIPMTFGSRQIIPLVYGDEFRAAAPILSIHIWAALFVFMGVVQSSFDLAENLTRLYLVRTTCGAIINIALNMWLIPLYSGVGAAIATVVSYAFAYYFLNLLSARTRPIFICQSRSFLFFRYLKEMTHSV